MEASCRNISQALQRRKRGRDSKAVAGIVVVATRRAFEAGESDSGGKPQVGSAVSSVV